MAKKDEAKETNGSAALAVVPRPSSITAPSLADIEGYEAAAIEKLAALSALLKDAELTAESKTKVQQLMELANPVKPGMEEVNTTWSVSRVSIAQPTTQSSAKPENAKQGDMFSSSGMMLERPFGFIPLYFNEANIMFKTGEKAPECSSPDAKVGSPYGTCTACPNLPFGKQNNGRGEQKKTDCNNQIEVTCISADLTQVYTVQFSKTSRSAGNALISLAKSHAFPWKQSYLLSTDKKVGDLGTYYVYKIEPTGKDNSPDAIKIAKALSELFGANRKRFVAEHYLRASGAGRAALAAESQVLDPSKLAAGLGIAPQGEELDLTDTPSGGVKKGTPNL